MSNYFRFLKDVPYDLLVPPHGIDYRSMTPAIAEEDFDWFLSVIPDRLAYFRRRCADDLGISVNELNFSPQSLLQVWNWFLNTARTEKTPKEQFETMQEMAKVFGETFVSKRVLTVATEFIVRDIAIYVGECYVQTYPSLHWSLKTKPKNDIAINQPVISGFCASNNGMTKELFFAPIHMVGVQASKLLSARADAADLYNVFCFWEQFVLPL